MHSSKCKNKPNNAEIFQKIPVYWFLQPFIRSIFLTQNTQLEYGKGGGGEYIEQTCVLCIDVSLKGIRKISTKYKNISRFFKICIRCIFPNQLQTS